MTESGTFETQTDYLESAPSPKRARFEGQQPEIVSVSGDDGTVTITVPQTQFEIEINSQQEEEEDDGSPSREIHQIQAGDLAGPAFEVIHEAKVRKKRYMYTQETVAYILPVKYLQPESRTSIGENHP